MNDDSPSPWTSAGVGAAAASPFAVWQAMRGFDLDKKLTQDRVQTWAEMRSRVKPGDLMFSYMNRDLAKWNDAIRAFTGDTFYHPSMYAGRGMMHEAGELEAAGKTANQYISTPAEGLEKSYDTVVVRPQVSNATRLAAIQKSRGMLGTPYDSNPKILGEGMAKLLGVPGPKGCAAGSINCQSALSDIYPRQIPDRFTTPDQILRKAVEGEGFDVVGRVARRRSLPLVEQLVGRVAHPALKWGLIAGIPAGLAHHYLSSRDQK